MKKAESEALEGRVRLAGLEEKHRLYKEKAERGRIDQANLKKQADALAQELQDRLADLEGRNCQL